MDDLQQAYNAYQNALQSLHSPKVGLVLFYIYKHFKLTVSRTRDFGTV